MGWKYSFVCDACLETSEQEDGRPHTSTVVIGSIAVFELCHGCSTKMLEGVKSQRERALVLLSLIKPDGVAGLHSKIYIAAGECACQHWGEAGLSVGRHHKNCQMSVHPGAPPGERS